MTTDRRRAALAFVVMMGVVSLFADMCYEGARSSVGAYLAVLGASGTAVGFIGGLGELIGYGLRYVSGQFADRTGAYWPLTIAGYGVNLIAVPALALAHSWWMVAGLVSLERLGKAVRSPAKSTLLSHAAEEIGGGKAFGIHQALDQIGAVTGPLIIAGVLLWRGDGVAGYRWGFAALMVPAVLTMGVLLAARRKYPDPRTLAPATPRADAAQLGSRYWMYLVGIGLVAAGLADWALLSFHLEKDGITTATWLQVVYAIAMGVDAIAALVTGRFYDRARARGGTGIGVLAAVVLVGAAYAPLLFVGERAGGTLGAALPFVGVGLWAMTLAATDSIAKAAVAAMSPVAARGRAYGTYYAVFGIAWWLGSLITGALYDHSHAAAAAFGAGCLLAAAAVLARCARAPRAPSA